MYSVLLGDSSPVFDASVIGGKAVGLDYLVRNGFPSVVTGVVTTDAFTRFIEESDVDPAIDALLSAESAALEVNLLERIRSQIRSRPVPQWLSEALDNLVKGMQLDQGTCFCLRSSATVEDLLQTSFAGVFESFINVSQDQLLDSLKECYASVFTEHAWEYARRNGVPLRDIRMAAVVQPVIAAHAAGVAFTCEPETGCVENVVIQSAFGFGEAIVSGELLPDTFLINKHTKSVIRRSIAEKPFKLVTSGERSRGIVRQENDPTSARAASLTDEQLARLFLLIQDLEVAYGSAADIEWVVSDTGQIILVQIRPLMLPPLDQHFIRYTLTPPRASAPVLAGQPITDHIVVGKVRRAESKEIVAKPGDVIVARHIDVDWIPNLREATAVITEGGGYTSHIAIILREMGIPALFGAEGGFDTLSEGEIVTVACNDRPGTVWEGELEFSKTSFELEKVYRPKTRVHLVSSSLSGIDKLLRLPLSGIGLVRLEFLISTAIGIHPMAIADHASGRNLPAAIADHIREKSKAHGSADEFYIATLTEAICAFASRCPEKVVNVRFADFLTDDYLSLVGGSHYETHQEANPMLGWRGTTRLIDEEYRSAFILDCKAFRRAIDDLGFSNINLLLPFCRMPEDVKAAIALIREFGPSSASIGMMVEVPSNVALASEFARLVDFFLVGPMDMTQLTYGADRKAKKLSRYNNETLATKEMVKIFLARISGCGKDVFIGGWPLFQYLSEYQQVQSNNALHLVELPDRLLELFDNLRDLEVRTLGGCNGALAPLSVISAN